MDEPDTGVTSDFLVYFPVWTIVDSKRYGERGITYGMAKVGTPETGVFLPFFTDEDLAERFIEKMSATGRLRPAEVNVLQMGDLLDTFQSLGVKYVGCDVELGVHSWGRFRTFEFIRNAIRKGASPSD